MILAAFDSITQVTIDNCIQLVAKERETSPSELSDFKTSNSSNLLPRSNDENFNWSNKQAYIGLGTRLIAAANLKIDATPMEGLDNDKFDALLRLKERKLKKHCLTCIRIP